MGNDLKEMRSEILKLRLKCNSLSTENARLRKKLIDQASAMENAKRAAHDAYTLTIEAMSLKY